MNVFDTEKRLQNQFLSHVKILPWLEFVGAWLTVVAIVVGLVAKLTGHGWWFKAGHVGAIAGVLLGILAFMLQIIGNRRISDLKHLLMFVGLLGAMAGAIFVGVHPVFMSIFCVVAIATSQAGQWYDEMYP